MKGRRTKTVRGRHHSKVLIIISILALVSLTLFLGTLSGTGSLREKWEHALEQNGHLEEHIQVLKTSARQLEEKNQALEEANTSLKEENLDLQEKVNRLEKDNAGLEADILLLRQQMQQRESSYRKEVLNGLVDIQALDSSIVVDLRYATEDNFTGRQLYPDNSRAYLRRETAVKMIQASEIFKKDGYTIKIWDAYRPLSVQRIMWEHSPLPGFLAHPDKGSNHNRGAAVDITLMDQEGNELEMPTGFDDFTEKAARDYADHSPEAKKNMDYLTQVMVSCGFRGIRTEWWHFDDLDAKNYPLLDVGLD